MLGLFFIVAGLIYLGVSIIVVLLAIRYARKRGVSGWKLGIPAGLVMYLLLFWDHLPTIVAHEYFCNKEAGFTVYKSLAQWKTENAGVADTLSSSQVSPLEVTGNTRIARLNKRFNWRTSEEKVLLSLRRIDKTIVDVKTDQVLAKLVDFRTGWGNFPITMKGLTSYKLWLVNKSCEEEGKMESAKRFSDFLNSVQQLGAN